MSYKQLFNEVTCRTTQRTWPWFTEIAMTKIRKGVAIWFVVIWAAGLPADAFHSGAFASPGDDKIKVFLLAGQSNMDGRGDGSRLTHEDKARLNAVRDRVMLAYNHQDIVPLGVTTPQGQIATRFDLDLTFGPELFFGLAVAEAWPDSKILLIKRSLGGSSLYGCWNPNWSLEKATLMNEAQRPKLYEDLVGYVRETLSEYDKDDYQIAGMLWVHGESDSNVKKFGPLPAEFYGRNLQNLIAAIRKDTTVAKLPFFMLQVGHGQVVEGMQSAANSMDNVYYISQNSDPKSPAFLSKYGPPRGHYDYEGMKRIGALFGEAVLSTYANTEVGRSAEKTIR